MAATANRSAATAVPKNSKKNTGFNTVTLMDCMAEMPPSGGRRPSALTMKAEKAKKIPATSPAPSAAASVRPNINLSMASPVLPARSGGLRAIDHPGRAKAVGQHAELQGPEGFAERHGHLGALGQRVEDALRLGRLLDIERHRHALHLLKPARRRIRGHQRIVAKFQAVMQDLVAPLRRRLVRRGAPCERHHGDDLAAENLGISPQGFLAIAVE